MKRVLTRRGFLSRSALALGALPAARLLSGPNILAATGAGDKLNCVQIGCGGRGMDHVNAVVGANKQNLIGIVDVFEPRHDVVKKWLRDHDANPDRVRTFVDYRKMFDAMHKEIDAVFIATPNHQHTLPAMIAMQLGIPVFCEKPVCHDIGEARKLRAMAKKYKAITQMGNQGHAEEGYRRLCEYVQAGAIGPIRETHSWTNRSNGGVGPRPPVEPVPAGLHWEEWLGPAPYRDFHSDLHPHEWHNWYDFGNGSIGNMGCHTLDGVFWALQIEHPTSVEAEEVRGGTDERYPTGTRIRWDVPARGNFPPLKVYWYDGFNKQTVKEEVKGLRSVVGEGRNLPPLLKELRDKYPDDELDNSDSGTLYVGDKGVIYTATYGGRMHIVPMEKMKEFPAPPKTLPRPKNIVTDFLDAIRERRTDTAVGFDYGTRLTEFSILGNLAQRAGEGKKLEWDGPKMKVTNFKEMNAFVTRKYRKGWRF